MVRPYSWKIRVAAHSAVFVALLIGASQPAPGQVESDTAPSAEPESREWLDNTGTYSLVATFAGLADGQVTLVRSNGQAIAVPLDRLSEADKRYVASVSAAVLIGTVVEVADGDTITVLRGATRHSVRLRGVDAPEREQVYGAQARKVLADRLLQKEVRVRLHGKDQQNRALGDVHLGSRWINQEMVGEGWAWCDRQGGGQALAQAEARARSQKLGLWQDPHPVAPWDHRLKTTADSAPADQDADSDDQNATVYVTKTGKRYHRADCRHLSKSSIPMPLSRAKDRYSPCDVCKPGVAGSPAPSSPSPVSRPSVSEPQARTDSHWLTTSSGVRHNSRCRYYQNSKGRPCGPQEGRACKTCGG